MREFDFAAGRDAAPADSVLVSDSTPLAVSERSIFSADYARDGADLVLATPGAVDLRLVDYFLQDTPPDLIADNGAVLRGDLVARLAGPIAPGQYAQAGDAPATEPIGQVETLGGVAFAERADGTRVQLEPGSKVFQNDVLITEDGGKLSVTFSDGTIFTLAANSRMVIDSLVYDAGAGDGNGGAFSLIEGGFVFIAGEVAKTGGMDVNTPTATMGIRGTTVLVEITTQDGISTVEVSLNIDPDGGIGSIELRDLNGTLIATIDDIETKWIVSPVEGETREVIRTVDDLADDQALLLDAARAYALAFQRVDAGGTFVELSSGSSTSSSGPDLGDEVETQGNDSGSDDDTPGGSDTGSGGTGGPTGGSAPGGQTQGEDTPANTEPEARNDARTLPEDGAPVTGNVLSNDSDADGDTLIVIVNTRPRHGTLDLDNATGNYTYTPETDYNGTDSFSYTISDGNGGTDSGTVTFTVTATEDDPDAEDDSLTLVEDGESVTINVLDNDSDADGDTLQVIDWSFSNEEAFSSGNADGSFTYTPPPDFFGSETFSYTVSDGKGNTDTATLTVSVTPVPDAPVANDASTETDEDTPAWIYPENAFTDADGDEVSLLSMTDPDRGSASYDGEGGFTYTPEENFHGEDSFTYTLTDGNGGTATATITVTVAPVNDAPVAQGSSVTTDEDAPVVVAPVFDEVDVDGDPVSLATFTHGAHGIVTQDETGELTYTPDADYHGTDSFTYTVTDSTGTSDTATVTVTVVPVNDAPVAEDSTVEVTTDEPYEGVVMVTDVEDDTLTFTLSAAPLNGTVTLDPDGSYTYTPDEGYFGVDEFEVEVSDGDKSDTAVITLEVARESYTAPNGQTVTMAISEDPVDDDPAGNVAIGVSEVDSATINLSFALDASGSVGSTGWTNIENAVYDAVEQLAAQFQGSQTTVNVQIVQYGEGVYENFTFEIDDPQLLTAIRALWFRSGGRTDWDEAMDASHAFFDSKAPGDTNVLYFVTDGIPSGSAWTSSLATLNSAHYDLDIQAFGIGTGFNTTQLQQVDSDGTPTSVGDSAALLAAIQESPLFAAELVNFTLSLTADGEAMVLSQTDVDEAIASDGLNFDVALAEIAGLGDLLGEENLFTATATFDLDGDTETTDDRITLTSAELISKQDAARTATGTDGSDLLLGSDADDDITGGDGNDLILGFDGNDRLAGGDGDDDLRGGAGDDTLVDDLGADLFDGGPGRDLLELATGAAPDLIQTLSDSNIEAVDLTNGTADALIISAADIVNLSDTADTDLELLLDTALGDSATILGETRDTLTLIGDWLDTETTVTDDAGNTLAIYQFNGGDGLVTLGIDDEVTVNIALPT
jgi:hypothetical protein